MLSTWRDTSPARLDEVRDLVDEIVLNDLPKVDELSDTELDSLLAEMLGEEKVSE